MLEYQVTIDDSLDARIRHVLSRLRDERGLGSRTLLAREAAALIKQLDALRIKAARDHSEG